MSNLNEFDTFPKIPRLNRGMVVTEKIDGTNAQVSIRTVGEDDPTYDTLNLAFERIEDGRPVDQEFIFTAPIVAVVRNGAGLHVLRAGSRNRWVTPGKNTDNQGWAAFVKENAHHLVALGHGRHFGEWWGKGIARGYDQPEKRFSLFNTNRWNETNVPGCCSVVPILYTGPFSTEKVNEIVEGLRTEGSIAAPGYKNPEGVIVFHTALNGPFKVTCVKDEKPKGQA